MVIPCTLSEGFIPAIAEAQSIQQRRSALGILDSDILFAYSGSTAGWQSFSLLAAFLRPLLKSQPSHKVVFLAKEEDSITQLKKEFPGQVQQRWLAHTEVKDYLNACDYGILIREESVTNQVASPTKFAEYLSAGLPVIISEKLGDYSGFAVQFQCGYQLSDAIQLSLFIKPTNSEKLRIMKLVEQHFTKQANNEQYKKMMQALTGHSYEQ